MTRLTPVFLVLLRLAIGWHFFFEGINKLPHDAWPVRLLNSGHPTYAREQARKEPWTSEGYLRESAGPLADKFREIAGDSVLERVQLPEQPFGKDVPPHKRLPAPLARDWDDYFQRFVQHYQVTDLPVPYLAALAVSPQAPFPANLPCGALVESTVSESAMPNQRWLIAGTFDQHKAQLARWLTLGTKPVLRETPSGPSVPEELTTPQRVQEYRDRVKKVRDIQDKEMATFGPDVNARLRDAKARANRDRADLRKDLDEYTLNMKKALHVLLTDNQRQTPLEPRYDVKTWEVQIVPPVDPLSQVEWKDMTQLQWADWTTRWGVFLVGCCLLLGLFTRLASVAGAGFLFMFYLALPPLLGLPDNPRAEGTYLFVNKNLIEMLALLALATTHSGRWVGLDGLLHCLKPWRWGGGVPAKPAVPRDLGAHTPRPDLHTGNGSAPVTVPPEPVTVSPSTTSPRESSDGH